MCNKLKRKICVIRSVYTYKPFGLFNEKKREKENLTIAYYCKNCNYKIEYKNQKIILTKQQEEKSIIINKSKKYIDKYEVKNIDEF